MLSKEDRLKFCNQCVHKMESKRYGTLCGLTENYPHFQYKCDHFKKSGTSFMQSAEKKDADARFDFPKQLFSKTSKKSKGSLVGKGVLLYILFKIVMRVLREFNLL